MSRKRFTAEQIMGLLGEADVCLSQGKAVGHVCREMGVTEQTYYRWRKEYGGMKTLQVKRLKNLERENSHLKKAVAELILDKLILKDVLEGDSYVPTDSSITWSIWVGSWMFLSGVSVG